MLEDQCLQGTVNNGSNETSSTSDPGLTVYSRGKPTTDTQETRTDTPTNQLGQDAHKCLSQPSRPVMSTSNETINTGAANFSKPSKIFSPSDRMNTTIPTTSGSTNTSQVSTDTNVKSSDPKTSQLETTKDFSVSPSTLPFIASVSKNKISNSLTPAPSMENIIFKDDPNQRNNQNSSSRRSACSIEDTEGNDQVTIERSHQPLVPIIKGKQSGVAIKTMKTTDVLPHRTDSSPKSNVLSGTFPITNAQQGILPPNSLSGCTPLRDREKIITTDISSSSAAPTVAGSVLQNPFDERAALEETITKERMPLVDKYAPYIAPSDISLKMARDRLRTALDQIRLLRAAFTERVYGKYRVCLRPPPPTQTILDNILADPISLSQKLQDEIRSLKEEKEIEKKEAQTLNAEMSANTTDPVTMNADNAEQLMFISAGLSLVILPEEDIDTEEIDMSAYKDRAPINPETGQRVRSISQAAAAAGEVMLDRARKGAAMREERQRRRQLQLLSGEDPQKMMDSSYSRLHILSTSTSESPAPSTITSSNKNAGVSTCVDTGLFTIPSPKAIKRPSGSKTSQTFVTQSGKGGRSRASTGMSTNFLLSLNPNAEEINSEGRMRASTCALMAKGIGSSASSRLNQQRLRHPHPNSLGGRHRSLNPISSKNLITSGNHLTQQDSLALPPLPTPRERKNRRFLSVLPIGHASSSRVKKTLQSVIGQFGSIKSEDDVEVAELRKRKSRSVTKIGLLLGMQKISDEKSNVNKLDLPRKEPSLDSQEGQVTEPAINPALVYSVLQAVGLVTGADKTESRSASEKIASGFDDVLVEKEHNSMVLPSFIGLKNQWTDLSSKKRLFSEAFSLRTQGSQLQGDTDLDRAEKCRRSACEQNKHEQRVKSSVSEEPAVTQLPSTPPIESIRGGGEILVDSAEDGSPAEQRAGSSEQFQDGRSSNLRIASQTNIPQPSRNMESRKQHTRPADRQTSSQSHSREVDLQRRILWDEQSQSLALMNSHIAANQAAISSNHSAGPAVHISEHQAGQSTLNALHLAQQLHCATTAITHRGGELGEYMGGLHNTAQPRPGGFDWPSIEAASAAAMAAAAHSSLAALELARHNAAMVGYSVQQDRAARALLAREQQSVAAAQQRAFLGGGASTAFPQSAAFSQAGPHSATSGAALLNTSAQAALMGHTTLSVAAATTSAIPSPSPMHSSASNDARARTSMSSDGGSSETQKADYEKLNIKLNETRIEDNPGAREDTKQIDSSIFVKQNSEWKSSTKRKVPEPPIQNNMSDDKKTDAKVQNALSMKKRKRAVSCDSFVSDKGIQNGTTQALSGKDAHGNVEKSTTNKLLHLDQAQEQKQVSAEVASRSTPSNVLDSNSLSFNPATTKVLFKESKSEITSNSADQRGMKFFLPPAPPSLTPHVARLIRSSRIHDAVTIMAESTHDGAAMLEYLLAVGTAVPIPKALISVPLKERLNTPGIRTPGLGGGFTIPREIVIASILVWLWTHHEHNFQAAFAKSGRIDVDPDCKWLIQAAVDSSVRAIMIEIADAISRGGGLLSSVFAASARSTKATATPKGVVGTSRNDSDRTFGSSAKFDLLSASIVSRALMVGLCIDDDVDGALPQFHELIHFLDKCRLSALHSRAMERVLFASLVSREATMSESFSHAYVSSMVRAGEALGHDKLSEIVTEEDLMVSTMLPYDIFKDETTAWEDTCRPREGFTYNLTGDILWRKAHARAMIQKSLKKLQDRHNIKDGTSISGAYDDPPSAQSPGGSASTVSGSSKTGAGAGAGAGSPSPRFWMKRKISAFSEPKVQPGTGSAQAPNWVVYDPKHFSVPLAWKSDDIENMPYGQYNKSERSRSLSFSQLGYRENKRGKRSKRSMSVSSVKPESSADTNAEFNKGFSPSTLEISWTTVSRVFEKVSLAGKSHQRKTIEHPASRTIISPFVRKIDSSPVASDTESDEDEDLRDETIISAHQDVLDKMKAKLSAYLEARKKQQDRRKNRYKEKT